MTDKKLPPRPNLDQYRKQAKDLLKNHESGQPEVLARIRQHHPLFKKTTPAIGESVFRLSDAQWVIAREHGFESWSKFAHHVRQLAANNFAGATPEIGFPVFAIDLEITTDELNVCVFTRDGRHAVSSDGRNPVHVWDVATGRAVMKFDDHSVGSWALNWSHDERHIYVGGRDGTVKIWNFESGACLHQLKPHNRLVRCIDVGFDSRLALTGAGHLLDPVVRLWDVESEYCLRILEGHSDGVYDVAFSPTQRRALSASRDTTIRLWDLESGMCLRVFKGHSYHVHSVLWSPDERRVLSCSQDIRLWDVNSGRCIRVFDYQGETIRRLAWSGDQRRALSASHNGTVQLWDVDTGRCLRVFEGHPVGVVTVAWSEDEQRAYSCDWLGGIRFWDLTE
jgi:WD40 repeat protein